MLLSDSSISNLIASGDLKFGPSFDSGQVQPSSVDLKIGKIYVPNASVRPTLANIPSMACGEYLLMPGGAVIVELQEFLELSAEVGGLLLPRNSLSKNGIIMTNPGHVDPGFKGLLTVCLINMGVGAISLEQNETVATMLLYRVEGSSAGYAGANGVGVTPKQLSKFAQDFANLSNRSAETIRDTIWKHMFAAVAIVSLVVAVLAVITPGLATVFSQMMDSRYTEAKNSTRIVELTEKIEAIERAQRATNNASSKSSAALVNPAVSPAVGVPQPYVENGK